MGIFRMSSDMSIAVGVDGEKERKTERQTGRDATSATWTEARGKHIGERKGEWQKNRRIAVPKVVVVG